MATEPSGTKKAATRLPRSTSNIEFYCAYVLQNGERGETTRLLLALINQAWKLRHANVKMAREACKTGSRALRLLSNWPLSRVRLSEVRRRVIETKLACNGLVAHHYKAAPKRASRVAAQQRASPVREKVVAAWHGLQIPERQRAKRISFDLGMKLEQVYAHIREAGLRTSNTKRRET